MDSDYGAFMEKFRVHPLPPTSPSHKLPLKGLIFAVKDIFDVEGYVTGFGNPDWAKTHSPAKSTSPVVLTLLRAGATCVGKTIMDEMAYSINGENAHYGTPRNPCGADRVPGGSSSGSVVAVSANVVDFSLGTDTGGSVRVPAAFCNVYGIRPSHGVISVDGVIPMAESFDTIGWFARDATLLKRIGKVLLPPFDMQVSPSQIIIPEDCFKLLSIPIDRVKQVILKSIEKLYGGGIIKHMTLGDYVKENVPSLMQFMSQGGDNKEYSIPSLAALSSAMRQLQRYEFKNNHGEWVTSVKPKLGPGLAERVWEAVRTNNDDINTCCSVKAELRVALSSLLGDFGILVIPTVPGPPPKLHTEAKALESFRSSAFSLLSIAGVSGFCQVNIPLGLYNNLPVSVSLLAKHGSDMFLLSVVESLSATISQQIDIAEKSDTSNL